ncbi:Wzy polymerase domain-containing protein [Cupriavidus sp. WKF15]|uniref:PglL family O-oligosaccharyltransferase n=1 Tax=Cupriavidus sp. WKF15 TaxID=3032282 RepID=UPI0023E1F58E|nr:Wzy polymerase domain-containing protein [Cupriavidus sp. WKF15]WER46536.1 Wzy polymerase domain-containing protein [Cupriavidus sp. WKF15]
MPPSRTAFAASAIALATVIPLLVSRHTLPLATFYGEWAGALTFLIAAFVLVDSRSNLAASNRGSIPWIALLPLGLVAVGLVQAAAGLTDPTGSRLATQLTLAFGAAVMLATWRYSRCASPDQRRIMADAIATAWLVAGLLGTLAQWVQLFHLEPQAFGLVSSYFYDNNRRLWGNLNQPNHQATVEGLALAASVWLASRGRLRFPVWLVATVLLESGIVLSGSRTGVLHVGLAAIYALIAAWFARDARRDADPMARPTGLVTAATVMVVMLLVLQPAIKAAGQAFDWRLFDTIAQLRAEDQVSARGALWAHAWATFRAHPWLGVGWGEFGWAQFQQLPQVGVKVEMSLHAHNAVLDLLAKTGILGTAGVALALAGWLWRVVRVRLWQADGEERAQTIVVLAWLAMLCAHSMLEYPLHYLYFFLPFCFMLGWLEPGGFGRWRLPGWLSLGLLAGFAAVSAIVLASMWQDYRRAEAREYASRERRATLPMPAYWFRQYASADVAERAAITPANAADLLPSHVAAVHLLPTPTMIARTAWLMALTGDSAQGRAWLERLRYYYLGDEPAQYAALDQACGEIADSARPREFCRWVREQARRMPE